MKWGLQARMIASFLLVMVLPLLITGIGLFITVPGIITDENLQDIVHTNHRANRIVERVEKYYTQIEDYDIFYRATYPLLAKFNGRLKVIDNNGFLLFDSSDRNASREKRFVGMDIIEEDDYRNEIGIYKYTQTVVHGSRSVGNALIYLNLNTAIRNILVKTMVRVGGSFASGLASMILMILLFSFLMSRSILIPLKELDKAVNHFAKGDIGYEIPYHKDNELGRLCLAFNEMGRRLKESLDKHSLEENARKELIASISHDLRTPIASIKGYVEGLQDGIVQDQRMFDRYLTVISDKTDKLDRLIDDLFQFSQLELGKLKMEFTELDSRELLEQILKGYEMDFYQHIVHFTKEEPFPSVSVVADPHRIAQVFDNIMQNAKKYVPTNGEIKVGAVVEGNFLKVYVRDNGTGISKEDMPHIFNRFYRGEKSRSRDFGGTGLGLAICKQIIEDHHGEIWADSVPGHGTTFYFTIPVKK